MFRRKSSDLTVVGQQGRSMIEMLGVLAVIGVLSVGGIYGYRIAIAKHRANEAAHLVSMTKMEMIAASNLENQADMYVDYPNGSPVSLAPVDGHPKAGIVVNFKDDEIACKQFLQMYQNSSDFAVKGKCN